MTTQKRVIAVVFYILILMIEVNAQGAEARTWINVGPVRGGAIFPDRSDPNRWYSFSYPAIYSTINGGRLWEKIPGPTTFGLTFHPFDATLYIAGRGSNPNEYSLLVSRDQGRSFVRTGTFAWGLRLYTDPLNSNTLYQIGYQSRNLYRTTDLGRQWQQITVSFTPSQTFGCSASAYSIIDVLASPFEHNSVFASISLDNCPYVNNRRINVSFIVASRDGNTWKEEFVRKAAPFRLFFDSATPNRAYGYSEYGGQIVVLTREGWQNFPEPPCPKRMHCGVQIVAVVPRQSDQLVVVQKRYTGPDPDPAQSEFKICVTSNHGGDWTITDSPFTENLFFLYVSDTQPAYQLAAEGGNRGYGGYHYGGGIYRKDTDWQPANRGFEKTDPFLAYQGRKTEPLCL